MGLDKGISVIVDVLGIVSLFCHCTAVQCGQLLFAVRVLHLQSGVYSQFTSQFYRPRAAFYSCLVMFVGLSEGSVGGIGMLPSESSWLGG